MEKDEHGKIILPPEVMKALEALGPVREVPRSEEQENCPNCRGYGLWGTGNATPMGPTDAGDGMPTIECPACHANPNPV